MNIARFIKVFLRNIPYFHPRYLLLVKKNIKSNTSIRVKKNNIFIVTSCINTMDCKKYPIHNLEHTPLERYEETLLGLASIRKYYIDSYIIFIESSKISIENSNKIQTLVDEYYNYSEYKNIKVARQHYNKGVPQFTALIKFIEESGHKYEAENFHFIGARYCLTGYVALKVKKVGVYFLNYPQDENVSTRYFFIKGMGLGDIVLAFRKTLYFAILGNSVEDYVYRFLKKVIFLEKLDIVGKINGVEIVKE